MDGPPVGGYTVVMTDPQTQHEDDDTTTAADTQSDPSLDDGESTDWSSEGGATPQGPATAAEDS